MNDLLNRINNVVKRFNDNWSDFEIDNPMDYVNQNSTLNIKHKICGCIFPRQIGNMLARNKICYCPRCNPKEFKNCIPYENDIYATNPELYALLKNKEDGHKYKESSSQKTWFTCPDCLSDYYKTISNVNYQGLCCEICNEGISYPEKLFLFLLKDLRIDYVSQFSPDWGKPYRYDFLITIKKKSYIVEMDGGWHYEKNNLSGKSAEEQQFIDKNKERLAQNNGYKIIRINCNYKNYSYRDSFILENIKKSKFAELVDLKSIKWQEIMLKANTPYLKSIVDLWETTDLSVQSIARQFDLKDTTIKKYLVKSCEIGMLNCTLDELRKQFQIRSDYYNKSHHYSPVLCNETGEIFKLIKDADKKYHANISGYFLDENRKFTGTTEDGTRLTWTKLTIDEYLQYTNKKEEIKDGNLYNYGSS